MRVLIAGGGIGGLTLALMLHRSGIECLVLEAAPEIRPLGVGINILPHAVRELASLGLLPALDEIGLRTRALSYLNHRGQVIWTETRGLHAGHDVPQFSIHRGRLQDMLWRTARERLGERALRPDARVAAATEADGAVRVTLTNAAGNRETIAGDVLIGADGIHSALRPLLLDADPPMRWNGIQMWRGALDWLAFGSGDEMIIAGNATAKLVFYPIGQPAAGAAGTRLTNWVVYARTGADGTSPPARESWSRRGAWEEFAPLVAGFALPFVDIERLARATREIFLYPMCDRDPLDRWTRGRIT
ncbi:MAG TPA: FAD-dependent monooxygenase, partial [Acidiphilium sp.]|nr:FAD-dependent monooxygenase [Acidiphilium sp.]